MCAAVMLRLPLLPAGFAAADKPAVATIAPVTRLGCEAAGRAYTVLVLGERGSSGDQQQHQQQQQQQRQQPELSISGADEAAASSSASSSSSSLKASASSESLSGINFSDARWEALREADIDHGDYYALLGLSERQWEASEEEIRRVYRIVSLVCHPDKARPGRREEAEERFKALQLALETLTEPSRRRAYDSSIDFDDSIPKDREGGTERSFYSVYEPVFRRNERFSLQRPAPQLGGPGSSDEEVRAFYDFWLSFRSWRDFSYLNEHRVEEAQSREEKRQFVRENEKKQAGKRKEEAARVRRLVEDAMRKDPRMQRMRKEEEDDKQRRKQQKLTAQRQREEEERRRKEEEEQRQQEERRRQQEAAAAEKDVKKALKSIRSYFGKYSREAGMREEDVEALRARLSLEQFTAVVDEFKRDTQAGRQLFMRLLQGTQDEDEEGRQRREERKAEDAYHRRKEEEEAEERNRAGWTAEEEQLLTKAIVRFPGGVSQRWEKITEMLNSHSHAGRPQRSIKEVIKKQRELEAAMGGVSVAQSDAYLQYQQRMKGQSDSDAAAKVRNAAREEAAELQRTQEEQRQAADRSRQEEERRQRLERETALKAESEREENEAVKRELERREAERVKEQRKREKKEQEKQEKAAAKARKDREDRERRAKQPDDSRQQQQQSLPADTAAKQPQPQPQPTPAPTSSPPSRPAALATASKSAEESKQPQPQPQLKAAVPAASASAGSDGWTADEQAALEAALKSVDKERDDRWDAIAAAVGSKSKKQCVARFRHCRQQIMRLKEQAART